MVRNGDVDDKRDIDHYDYRNHLHVSYRMEVRKEVDVRIERGQIPIYRFQTFSHTCKKKLSMDHQIELEVQGKQEREVTSVRQDKTPRMSLLH